MTCEQPASATVSAAASGPGEFSDGNPSTLSTSTSGVAIACGSKLLPDGGPACTSSAPTSPTGSPPPWMVAWISSQRDSLAAILAQQAAVQDSRERAPGQRMPASCEQSTLGDLLGCSWKTALSSARAGETLSGEISGNADTSSETESLERLMLAVPMSAIAGMPSLLGPTLVRQDSHGHDQVRGQGAAASRTKAGTTLPGFVRTLPTLMASDAKSGAGWMHGNSPRIAMALKMLPTLCATDSKSPYSADGYAKQTKKRSKPLRDTAAHTIGIRLTEIFCAWWMGWPVEIVTATRALGLQPSVTHGSRSKRQRRGISSVAPKRYVYTSDENLMAKLWKPKP